MTSVAAGSSPLPAAASLSREVKVLAGVAVVVALGFGIVGPALPLLGKQFGVGHAATGMAISAFAFFRFASAFANGRLVQRYGERLVLGIGLALQSVTTIAAGLAPTFSLVVGLRALGGLGSAAFTVSALALALRTSAPEMRARSASVYQGGFLVGAVGGPAIGGFLAEISPRVPFVVYGVLLAVAGVIGMMLLKDVGQRSEPTEADIGPLAVVAEPEEATATAERVEHPMSGRLWSRAFIAALLLNLGSGWMLYGLRNSLIPVFGTDVLGHTAAWVGIAFLVASGVQVIALLRTGRWADTWGRRPAMVAAAVIGLAASLLLMTPANTTVFMVAMVGFGLSSAFISSAPPAVIGDVARGDRAGTGVALFSMASDLGAVLGPVLGGWLADTYSYATAFGSGSLIFLVAVVATLVMQETGRPQRTRAARRSAAAWRVRVRR